MFENYNICQECGSLNLSEVNDLSQKVCSDCGLTSFIASQAIQNEDFLTNNSYPVKGRLLSEFKIVDNSVNVNSHCDKKQLKSNKGSASDFRSSLLHERKNRKHFRRFRLSECYTIIFYEMITAITKQPGFLNMQESLLSVANEVWLQYLAAIGELGPKYWAYVRIKDRKFLEDFLNYSESFYSAPDDLKNNVLNEFLHQYPQANRKTNQWDKFSSSYSRKMPNPPYPFWPGCSIYFDPQEGGLYRQFYVNFPLTHDTNGPSIKEEVENMTYFDKNIEDEFDECIRPPKEKFVDYSFNSFHNHDFFVDTDDDQDLDNVNNSSFLNLKFKEESQKHKRKRSFSDSSNKSQSTISITSQENDPEIIKLLPSKFLSYFPVKVNCDSFSMHELNHLLACVYLSCNLTLKKHFSGTTPIFTISDMLYLVCTNCLPFISAHLNIPRDIYHYERIEVFKRLVPYALPTHQQMVNSIEFLMINIYPQPIVRIPLTWLVDRYLNQLNLPECIKKVSHSLLKEIALFMDQEYSKKICQKSRENFNNEVNLCELISGERYACALIFVALKYVFKLDGIFEEHYENVYNFLTSNLDPLKMFLEISQGDSNFFSIRLWLRRIKSEMSYLEWQDKEVLSHPEFVNVSKNADEIITRLEHSIANDKAGVEETHRRKYLWANQEAYNVFTKPFEYEFQEKIKNNKKLFYDSDDYFTAHEDCNNAWEDDPSPKPNKGMIYNYFEWKKDDTNCNIDFITKISLDQVREIFNKILNKSEIHIKALESWLYLLEHRDEYKSGTVRLIVRKKDEFRKSNLKDVSRKQMTRYHVDCYYLPKLIEALNLANDFTSPNYYSETKEFESLDISHSRKSRDNSLFHEIFRFFDKISGDQKVHFRNAINSIQNVSRIFKQHTNFKLLHFSRYLPFLDLSPYENPELFSNLVR